MVESIMRGRRQVIPVSAYLDGEYGHSGVCIGVPTVIGRGGIEEIVELDLGESERAAFGRGVESVRHAIGGLNVEAAGPDGSMRGRGVRNRCDACRGDAFFDITHSAAAAGTRVAPLAP